MLAENADGSTFGNDDDLPEFFRQQCGGLNEAFRKLDVDGTGNITQDRFVEGLRRLQYPGDGSAAFGEMCAASGIEVVKLYDFIKYFATRVKITPPSPSPSPGPPSAMRTEEPYDIAALVNAEVKRAMCEVAVSHVQLEVRKALDSAFTSAYASWEAQAKQRFEAQMKTFAAEFENCAAETVAGSPQEIVAALKVAKESDAAKWETKLADVEKELRARMVATEAAFQGLARRDKELRAALDIQLQAALEVQRSATDVALQSQRSAMEAMQQKIDFGEKKLEVFIQRVIASPIFKECGQDGVTCQLVETAEATLPVGGSETQMHAEPDRGSDVADKVLEEQRTEPDFSQALQALHQNLLSGYAQQAKPQPLARLQSPKAYREQPQPPDTSSQLRSRSPTSGQAHREKPQPPDTSSQLRSRSPTPEPSGVRVLMPAGKPQSFLCTQPPDTSSQFRSRSPSPELPEVRVQSTVMPPANPQSFLGLASSSSTPNTSLLSVRTPSQSHSVPFSNPQGSSPRLAVCRMDTGGKRSVEFKSPRDGMRPQDGLLAHTSSAIVDRVHSLTRPVERQQSASSGNLQSGWSGLQPQSARRSLGCPPSARSSDTVDKFQSLHSNIARMAGSAAFNKSLSQFSAPPKVPQLSGGLSPPPQNRLSGASPPPQTRPVLGPKIQPWLRREDTPIRHGVTPLKWRPGADITEVDIDTGSSLKERR